MIGPSHKWQTMQVKIVDERGNETQYAFKPLVTPEIDITDTLELAWGLIANAYGGDWDKATDEWREAAERWRDQFHDLLEML